MKKTVLSPFICSRFPRNTVFCIRFPSRIVTGDETRRVIRSVVCLDLSYVLGVTNDIPSYGQVTLTPKIKKRKRKKKNQTTKKSSVNSVLKDLFPVSCCITYHRNERQNVCYVYAKYTDGEYSRDRPSVSVFVTL